MEAVIFRRIFFRMALLPTMFRIRLLTAAIQYRDGKQAPELSIRKYQTAQLRAVPIHQGAETYVTRAIPFEARNTAYERPFIVSTVNVTGVLSMATELT